MPLFGPPDIPRPEAKRDVQGLVKALQYEKDSQVPCDAVEALGKIGDARAVKLLVAALSDPDSSVHKVAEEALAHVGPPAARLLIVIFNDQNPEVCSRAAAALRSGTRARECAVLLLKRSARSA